VALYDDRAREGDCTSFYCQNNIHDKWIRHKNMFIVFCIRHTKNISNILHIHVKIKKIIEK